MRARTYHGIVFLAEDEDRLRDETQHLLEGAGYLVLTARDGVEALARMRGFAGGSVAIIDLLMPGMDGWELVDAMRGDSRLAQIPIIVTSGQRRAVVPGADRFVAKPYRPSELLAAVHELLPH